MAGLWRASRVFHLLYLGRVEEVREPRARITQLSSQFFISFETPAQAITLPAFRPFVIVAAVIIRTKSNKEFGDSESRVAIKERIVSMGNDRDSSDNISTRLT